VQYIVLLLVVLVSSYLLLKNKMARKKKSDGETTSKRKETETSEESAIKKPKTRSSSKTENLKRSNSTSSIYEDFFDSYKDESGESIDPFGLEKLFNDLGYPPESIEVLLLCYKISAKVPGYFYKDEFVDGMKSLRCSNATQLKKNLKDSLKDLDNPTKFKELYEYAFKFSKGDKENSRTIDTESAKGMIQILMTGRFELGEKFALFLEQSNYKAMNLDQWMCLLEFARNVKSDLSNLNEKDNFWPLIIDEFIEWMDKDKNPNKSEEDH